MTKRRLRVFLLSLTALMCWVALAPAASTEYQIYKVRPGDSVTRVARLFGIEPVVIIVHNNLQEPYRLSVGQSIKIPKSPQQRATTTRIVTRTAPRPATSARPPSPQPSTPAPSRTIAVAAAGTYTVKSGDTLAAIARKSNTTIEYLAAINGLKDPSSIYPGQTLHLSGSVSPSEAFSSADKSAKGGGDKRTTTYTGGRKDFAWPVRGRIIKEYSPSGYMKCWGIMIAAPEGTPIQASRAGVVTYSDSSIPGYGNAIIIDHGDNYYSVYAHNKTNRVRVDQRVRQGDQIALVGKRPQDPEHNLYFEIRDNKGQAIDPIRYLPN